MRNLCETPRRLVQVRHRFRGERCSSTDRHDEYVSCGVMVIISVRHVFCWWGEKCVSFDMIEGITQSLSSNIRPSDSWNTPIKNIPLVYKYSFCVMLACVFVCSTFEPQWWQALTSWTSSRGLKTARKTAANTDTSRCLSWADVTC